MVGLIITPFFQKCSGISMVVLSVAGAYSMATGAMVKINVAGTNISVNEKLQRVQGIAKDLEQSAEQLKLESGVSPIKIEAIEAELEQVESALEATEKELEADLKQIVELKPEG